MWLAPALAILAVVCAIWAPFDPGALDLGNRLGAPSWRHPLGTDHLGRDLLSRMMVGAAQTLGVVGVVAAAWIGLGTLIGMAAAVRRGWLAALLLRAAEFATITPALIVAMVLTALLGFDGLTAGLALGGTGWGPFALLAHGLARRVLGEPYAQAARALGAGDRRLAFRHVLPAILDTQLAFLSAKIGRIVMAYAALAFLGLGIDIGRPDWGAMIFEYRLHAVDHPRLILAPGLAVVLCCIALRAALLGGAPRPGREEAA